MGKNVCNFLIRTVVADHGLRAEIQKQFVSGDTNTWNQEVVDADRQQDCRSASTIHASIQAWTPLKGTLHHSNSFLFKESPPTVPPIVHNHIWWIFITNSSKSCLLL